MGIFKKTKEVNQIRVDVNTDPKATGDNVIVYFSKDGKRNMSSICLSWDETEELIDLFDKALEMKPECELKEVKDDK